MPKTTYILAVMLYSVFSYGQQIIFHQNSNYKANTLLQNLNKEGDSLLLESKTNHIVKVEIFNENYSKGIDVGSKKTKIDLKTLPLGNFVIQAKLDQKWIVMYLEKKEGLKITSSDHNRDNKDVKIASLHQKKYINNEKSLATINKTHIITEESDSFFYWVVSESNSSFGSSKTMRLEYKDDVAKIISKVKLELKTDIGKNNKLFIYEIYNRSKFMTKQLRNSEYYKSETSTNFNVVPIYASID